MPLQSIAAFTDMSVNDLRPFIAELDAARKAFEANPKMTIHQLKAISKLDEAELTPLLTLLKRK